MSALLDAILAAPDDDAPRLVYADHLLEQGDGHGELIAVQCERERLEQSEATATSTYRVVRARERELLRTFAPSFMRSFSRDGFDGTFHRGFLTHVTRIPWTTLRRDWADVLSRQPIESIAVSEVQSLSQLGWLARQPGAERLKKLTISGRNGAIELDAPLAFQIEKSDEQVWRAERGLPHESLIPAVTAVHYLWASEDALLDLLANEPPRLSHFTCANGLRFAGDALGSFTRSALFGQLSTISAWRTNEAEALLLLRGRPKALTLSAETMRPFTPKLAAELAAWPGLAQVERLDVNVALDGPVVRALADGRLTDLRIDGGLALADFAPIAERLHRLELADPSRPSVRPLAAQPFARLTSLALGNFTVDADLPLDTVIDARFFGCQFTPEIRKMIETRWPEARFE